MFTLSAALAFLSSVELVETAWPPSFPATSVAWACMPAPDTRFVKSSPDRGPFAPDAGSSVPEPGKPITLAPPTTDIRPASPLVGANGGCGTVALVSLQLPDASSITAPADSGRHFFSCFCSGRCSPAVASGSLVCRVPAGLPVSAIAGVFTCCMVVRKSSPALAGTGGPTNAGSSCPALVGVTVTTSTNLHALCHCAAPGGTPSGLSSSLKTNQLRCCYR